MGENRRYLDHVAPRRCTVGRPAPEGLGYYWSLANELYREEHDDD
jgi:hypothetical protein